MYQSYFYQKGITYLMWISCILDVRKKLAHMEMICAIVHQLTKNLSPEEIERSGFAPYYVDHTLALWPQAASGAPWTATYFQSKGDPITDLHEDLAADGATA